MNAPARIGPTMNRKRVIVWMTVAVAVLFIWMMATVFGGLPPWPVVLWIVASHVFFCAVVVRVRPFTGPYTTPMDERSVKDWD